MRSNTIQLQFSIFIITALMFLYILNILNILNIDTQVATSLVLAVFLWSYFISGYIGMNFYHPYRLYLLVFFLFNGSGFVYCLFSGADFFDYSFGAYSTSNFTDFVRAETLFSISFFLISLHLGASTFIEINKKISNGRNTLQLGIINHKNARITGILLFAIFLIPSYYYYYTIIIEAFLLGGYREYVGSESKGTMELPLIIRASKDFFIFGFWLYLSTIPSGKKLFLTIILYISPYILLSFFTGSRVSAVAQCVAILVYLTLVDKIDKNKVPMLIFGLILFVGFVGLLRTQLDYSVIDLYDSLNANNGNPIKDIVYQLGATAHTIGLTIFSVENNLIKQSIMFFLEPLHGQTGYQPHKAAESYYYLADRLSYYYMNDFMYGSGTGSSIVAEFYVVGGIFGAVIFPFVYAYAFFWLLTRLNGVFSFLFFLIILPGFYYTARSHPLTPLLFAKHQIILMVAYIILDRLIKMNSIKTAHQAKNSNMIIS